MTRPLTASERQRMRTSANLWRALIPLVVLVVVMVVVFWPGGHTAKIVNVNVAAVMSEARPEVGFDPIVPSTLPDGWRATSDTVTAPQGATAGGIRIGYLTSDGKYAELYQSNDAPAAVGAVYGPLQSTAPVTVNGVAWDGYQTNQNRQLILHQFGKVTVLVTGAAKQAELVTLAASVG